MKTALLHKYIIGEATEAEQKEVIEWINESPEHLHQYTTLRRLHDLTLWNISPQIEEHKNQRHIPWRKITDKVLKIAAIIALLFLGNLKSATTRLYDTEAKIICIVSKKGAQCIECHHKDI